MAGGSAAGGVEDGRGECSEGEGDDKAGMGAVMGDECCCGCWCCEFAAAVSPLVKMVVFSSSLVKLLKKLSTFLRVAVGAGPEGVGDEEDAAAAEGWEREEEGR
jgi:hypothetical protein